MADGLIGLFQGSRGCGKTLGLTSLGLDFYACGWKIYSNFRCSFAEVVSNDFIRNIDKHTDLHDCVLLIDELQILFDSRLWKNSTSIDFSHFIQQIRKRNVVILGSTQYTDTVEKRIRQHVDLLICPKFYDEFGVSSYVVIDLTSLEDLDSSDPLSVEFFYYAESLFDLYDTKEIIC